MRNIRNPGLQSGSIKDDKNPQVQEIVIRLRGEIGILEEVEWILEGVRHSFIS